MKYLLFIFFPWTYFFSQEIHIRIPDDKPFVIEQMEYKKICFTIENTSAKKYALIFDKNGFNSISNEVIDSPFLGLPFFRIYKGETKLKGEAGSYQYYSNPQNSISKKDLRKYTKKSKVSANLSDINKRIILLKPKEIKSVCMDISLPIYNSGADSGSLLYELNEGEEYFFQIYLNIPANVLKEYVPKLNKISNGYTLFSGSIESNKIPFVYK